MSLRVAAAAFQEGYRLARIRTGEGLREALRALGAERTPFAVEGAAMASYLRSSGTGHDAPLATLLEWDGGIWTPFVRLGAGCAAARLAEPPPEDPMAQDGFGFQSILTAGVSGHRLESGSTPLSRGQGRALWFVLDGDAPACVRRLADVPNPEGLWRGLGTACTFAGDPRDHAERLAEMSERHHDDLTLGARDALALWDSVGGTPDRAVRSAKTLVE